MLADRRPYFTMKLVKGRTLAELLSERRDGNVARLLGIFESVCQTVAYAHARGVIHRDLKPSNVMVGNFGEVQVMDWGLAKVLPRGGAAANATAVQVADETVVVTARSGQAGSDADLSRAGSVMGTPAYMAPEQARGDVVLMDERVDVFALGSMLCEVLTGQPAFLGRSSGEILRRAAQEEVADALTRLDECGADAGLVALARACLAPGLAERPRDAGVVAGRISAHLVGVQERLRAAERERAVAVARAVEERRRRKLQAALAAALLALLAVVTAGGLGTTYYLQQKQARAASVGRIMGVAMNLRDQARADADDVARWDAALVAIRRVEDLLGRGDSDGGGAAASLRQLAAPAPRWRPAAPAPCATAVCSTAWSTSAAPRPTTPMARPQTGRTPTPSRRRESTSGLWLRPRWANGSRRDHRPRPWPWRWRWMTGRAYACSRALTGPGRNGSSTRPVRRTPTPGAASSAPRCSRGTGRPA